METKRLIDLDGTFLIWKASHYILNGFRMMNSGGWGQ
jgi:hypothetical protein